MVKGISRRVVVVDSPDRRFFEQAIFIVRNDAAGEGVTSRELVEEARRVARSYTGASGRWGRVLRNLPPAIYTLLGSAGVGLIWLLTTLSRARGRRERKASPSAPGLPAEKGMGRKEYACKCRPLPL